MHKRIALLVTAGLLTAVLVIANWSCVSPDESEQIVTFAVLADPHIALPALGYTLETCPYIDAEGGQKLHRESVELFTAAIEMVNAIPSLDFVVILGDLTKDSERYNHVKLLELLPQFEAPVYVIVGNHDRVHPPRPDGTIDPDADIVDAHELPTLYEAYWGPHGKTYYGVTPAPGVQLLALDSTRYRDHKGEINETQLEWLRSALKAARQLDRLPVVMLHHCVAAHVPAFVEGHPVHDLFGDMMIYNGEELKPVLKEFGVPFVLSGHFHVQDITEEDGIYYIATGSVVTYPHPIRIMELDLGSGLLKVTTRVIESIPSQRQLQAYSEEALAGWFEGVVLEFLAGAGVPEEVAKRVAEHVRGGGGELAAGDAQIQYEFEDVFPEQTSGISYLDEGLKMFLRLLNDFSATPPPDNNVILQLHTG